VATIPSILLVDDDVALCELLVEYLGANGYAVDCEHDGAAGLRRALDGRYDLVILDVMLPMLAGFDVLRRLRQRATLPVIMLTARVAEDDRVSGLDAGADDYIIKPFGASELVARIRAVLRRVQRRMHDEPAVLDAGGLRLNVRTHQAWAGGTPIELTPIEFEILELLMRTPGRVVSRDEITGVLHERPSTPYDRSVDVHMSHLRKKLSGQPRVVIRTVRGVGYVFAEVD
jgi:two-component system response regulator CpxR